MTDRCALVVEDDALIALSLCAELEAMGVKVCGVASTAREAVALADAHDPPIILMDVRLSGREDGIDAATEIRTRHSALIVFLTGSRDPETVLRMQQQHPAEILFKPIPPNQIRQSIERLLGGAG